MSSSISDQTPGGIVRLAVDQEVCIGMGQCELLEPEQFLVDDDTGVASATGDGVSPERAAQLIDACPSGAIGPVRTPEELTE